MQMYSDVVMEKAGGVEPKEGQGIRVQLEHELAKLKKRRGYQFDTELTVSDLKALVKTYKAKIKKVLGKSFPDDPMKQLWGGIGAVFRSWNGKRAMAYRRIEGIPDEWGTAVNVQTMVFGNMGENSATGVAFTRNPATGENAFYGEWLVNAQGEDVVAGIRTPNPLNRKGKTADTKHLLSLEEMMPKLYRQLVAIRNRLEKHYRDMQDVEFTIEDGRLWMLQTRTGKRNGMAAVRMATEMAAEKLINARTAVSRVKPSQLDELLHPMVDPKAEKSAREIARGLPAGPGGAAGCIVLTAEEAEKRGKAGEQVILVREETSPEDVAGMHAAQAILTAKGGMTSHAALVARGWGKCCIVGCGALDIDMRKRSVRVKGRTYREGDWVTLNGTLGRVYEGKLSLLPADPEKNRWYKQIMEFADGIRRLGVRTNADRPEDAAMARRFGAQGIGLCRTEHMFFGDDRIAAMRQMILAETVKGRKKALAKLFPLQKRDFVGIFKAMDGLPVTIRLLDPPLHEFVPKEKKEQQAIAKSTGRTLSHIREVVARLHELNPMLGHRGCRLGITYPEIYEMQVRAIMEAACTARKRGINVMPEIMIPLAGKREELAILVDMSRRLCEEVLKKAKLKFKYLVGTMIEVPRAALTAGQIAEVAEFFSFGTNDLTQMTLGFSRDDVGSFLPEYLEEGIYKADPFQVIDREGVGQLVEMGISRGRAARKGLKVGICGEHGGDPETVIFCHAAGMDYVSCSPFRVPVARLAAAHAVLQEGN
jgi:pyruvate,orthophosphate dikinase